MSIAATTVDYYARRAREYERIYQKPERQEDLRTLRKSVGQLLAGKKVFEIACGTGYWTEVISHTAATVTATDINEEVLEIARAKGLAADKVIFQRADVFALPEYPQLFTGGLAAFWWSHVPKSQRRSFLTHWHRAFAPGARLVMLDNVYVPGSSTPIARTDTEGNTYQNRTLDDGSGREVIKNFPTEAELRADLEESGTEITVQFLPYFWVTSYTLRR